MTSHRKIGWWITVDEVLTRLGLERDAKTITAIQAAIDLHLLLVDSRADPGSVIVTAEGRELATKNK